MKVIDNQPKAYDLINYDLVYIVLKPNTAIIVEYTDLVKFDSQRKKYYLMGKLVKKERINLNTSSIIKYPKFRTLSLVHIDNWLQYSKSLKEELKEKYIINIHFSSIDCITLPFDSFDWKK